MSKTVPAPRGQRDLTLILMCGLPYSGKTTRALALGHPIVSPDAIRLALHGERYLQAAEPWVWTIARTMVEALFAAGHNTVIVDACNQSEGRRAAWHDLGYLTAEEVIRTAPEVCKDRALEAGDHAILPIITRMTRSWDLGDFEPIPPVAGGAS